MVTTAKPEAVKKTRLEHLLLLEKTIKSVIDSANKALLVDDDRGLRMPEVKQIFQNLS